MKVHRRRVLAAGAASIATATAGCTVKFDDSGDEPDGPDRYDPSTTAENLLPEDWPDEWTQLEYTPNHAVNAGWRRVFENRNAGATVLMDGKVYGSVDTADTELTDAWLLSDDADRFEPPSGADDAVYIPFDAVGTASIRDANLILDVAGARRVDGEDRPDRVRAVAIGERLVGHARQQYRQTSA